MPDVKSAQIDAEALDKIYTLKGNSLYELSNESPVLLIFLRHFGCIFCREALNDISKKREEFKQRGVEIVFVHMSDDRTASQYFNQYGLEGVDSISDPDCIYYEQFGLLKGNFRQLYGLKVWMRGFETTILEGNKFSLRQIGDGFQMPGVFLIQNGRIIESFVHKSAADRPDYAKIIECCAA